MHMYKFHRARTKHLHWSFEREFLEPKKLRHFQPGPEQAMEVLMAVPRIDTSCTIAPGLCSAGLSGWSTICRPRF